MAWYAVAIGGASLVGGYLNNKAAGNAAGQASQANANALGQQQNTFDRIQSNNAPWMQAGQNAVGQMGQMAGPGGSMSHAFNNTDLQSNLAPNYQFGLNTGLQETQNAANAQGGLGGNEMLALNNYSQNYAGNAYQNAFNNYQTSQNNIFNRLGSIASLGQNAASNTGNTGAQISGGMANSAVGIGQAQAAGTIGQANAISNGIGGAAMWGAMPSLTATNNTSTPTTNPTSLGTGFYNPNGQTGVMYASIGPNAGSPPAGAVN